MPTFFIECKAKFQLEVRDNNIIIPPPPVQVYGPPLGFVDPRLRTAVLNCDNGVFWQCVHASEGAQSVGNGSLKPLVSVSVELILRTLGYVSPLPDSS